MAKKSFTITGTIEDHSEDGSTNILNHPNHRLNSKELPKSVRLPLDTHSAISTLASIENKKIYEVVTDLVEDYVQNSSPQVKKLIKMQIEAIKQGKDKQNG